MTRDEMRLRLIAAAAPHLIANGQTIQWAADRCVDFADAALRSMDARDAEVSENLRASLAMLMQKQATRPGNDGGAK